MTEKIAVQQEEMLSLKALDRLLQTIEPKENSVEEQRDKKENREIREPEKNRDLLQKKRRWRAGRLQEHGIRSSHQIAALSKSAFVRKYRESLSLTREEAEALHSNAERVSHKAWQLYVGLKTTQGSEYCRQLLGKETGGDAEEFFAGMPGYQDIFGCLEAGENAERSIFSPAAYFVDLMRIVDKYITQAYAGEENGQRARRIPEGFSFPERRPDLMNLVLSRENMEKEISYASLAAKRMLSFLLASRGEEEASIFSGMASLTYPACFPISLPLEAAGIWLDRQGTSLEALYEETGAGEGKAELAAMKVSRDFLELLLGEWSEKEEKNFFGGAELDSLRSLPEFLYRTGLSAQDAEDLFVLDFTAKEQKEGLAASLFINRSVTGKPPYIENGEIIGLTREGFADILRFLKIFRMTGLSMKQTDWLLRREQCCAEALTVTAEHVIGIRQLVRTAEKYKISIEDMIAFTGPMCVYGESCRFAEVFCYAEEGGYPEGSAGNPAWSEIPPVWERRTDLPLSMWLASCLELPVPDLFILADALFEEEERIELDQERLACLYRHRTLAKYLGAGIEEYLIWLFILGFGIREKQVFTAQEISQLMEKKALAGMNGYQADYLINHRNTPYCTDLFTEESAEELQKSIGLFSEEAETAEHEAVTKLALFFQRNEETLSAAKGFLPEIPEVLKGYIQNWYDVWKSQEGEIEKSCRSYRAEILAAFSKGIRAQELGIAPEILEFAAEWPGAFGLKSLTALNLDGICSMQLASGGQNKYGTLYKKAAACFDREDGQFSSGKFAEAVGAAKDQVEDFLTLMGRKDGEYPIQYLHRFLAAWKQKEQLGLSSGGLAELLSIQDWDYEAAERIAKGLAVMDGKEIRELKRRTLLSLVTDRLHRINPAVREADQVYGYLLMDVSMEESVSISPVREGINALQLYLQRCRMGLEPGIREIGIPDSWWQWLMDYRQWEANRRIFVYPENYLLPELRMTKTSLFREMETALKQAKPEKGYVEGEYLNYLEKYESLVKLKPCAAYRTLVDGIDELYLFGKTREEPVEYYYCSSMDEEAFGEWKKIGIRINAEFITPVYVFHKLYLFWVERKQGIRPDLEMKEQELKSGEQQTQRISIYYTFLNLRGEWSTPQTLIKDQLVLYQKPGKKLDKAFSDSFHMEDQSWNRLLALRLGEENFREDQNIFLSGLREGEERLLLMLGGFTYHAEIPKGSPEEAAADTEESEDGQHYQARMARMKNHLHIKHELGETGHYLNGIVRLLNEDMEEVSLAEGEPYYLFDSYEAGMPGITAAVDSLTGQVGIRYCGDILKRALKADQEVLPEEKKPEIQISSGILESYTISKTAADKIYKLLEERGIVEDGRANEERLLWMDLYSLAKADYEAKNACMTPASFLEVRDTLLSALGSVRLFQRNGGFTVIPVTNQPGAFLCDCKEESFLIQPEKEDLQYSLLDRSLRVRRPKFTYVDLFDLELKSTTCDSIIEKLRSEGILDKKGYLTSDDMGETEFFSRLQEFFQNKGVTEEKQRLLYQKLFQRQIVTSEMFCGANIPPEKSSLIFQELTGCERNELFRLDVKAAREKRPGEALAPFCEELPPDTLKDIYTSYLHAPSSVSLRYVNTLSRTDGPLLWDCRFRVMRLTNASIGRMKQKVCQGGIDRLLAPDVQDAPVVPVLPFDRYCPDEKHLVWPEAVDGVQVDFDGLYREYNWELFYHIPMLIVENLKDSQKNEEAKKWMEYIFAPGRKEDELAPDCFARLAPKGYFTKEESVNVYAILSDTKSGILKGGRVVYGFGGIIDEKIKEKLYKVWNGDEDQKKEKLLAVRNILLNASMASPNCGCWNFRPFRHRKLEDLLEDLKDGSSAMRVYNDDPFHPHAVAGLRIGAYEKYTVMEYIRNLIEWGDREFCRYTWESLTQAANLYVMAQGLLGKRPVKKKPKDFTDRSFAEIKKVYEEKIPQFLLYLECALKPEEKEAVGNIGEGFLPDLYFRIPENEELIQLWDTVEDRLFKLRHSMDITGTVRAVSLYGTPVNPLRAAMAGAFSNETGALPQAAFMGQNLYRFSYLYEQAVRLAEHLIQLGYSLLSVLEKYDSEGLRMLLETQEETLLQDGLAVREGQVRELEQARKSLDAALESAKSRGKYYESQVSSFMSAGEIAGYTLSVAATAATTAAGVLKTTAGVARLLPQVGSPFAMKYGGVEVGSSAETFANALETDGNALRMAADCANVMAEYQRRREEWKLQKMVADYDVQSLQAQLEQIDEQTKMAEKEVEIQKRIIVQKQELAQYYQKRFTGEELYLWMSGKLKGTMFQSYQTALELARKAQAACQSECSSDREFLNFPCWDTDRCGILSGESLLASLHQMNNAYLSGRKRALEAEKDISLLRECPEAFFMLRSTGECRFNLTEEMFAYDYPGMYLRKIKSVSLTVPALLAPYQTLCATLVQEKNYVCEKPGNEEAERFLFDCHKNPESPPAGVKKDYLAGQKIAVSRGNGDMGILDFGGIRETCLPFEGTGVVSSWQLRMPKQSNLFSYESISDIIIHIQYTGYEDRRQEELVTSLLAEYYPRRSGFCLNLKQFYGFAWKQFLQGTESTEQDREHRMRFSISFPEYFFLEGGVIKGALLYLSAEIDLPESYQIFTISAPGHQTAILDMHKELGACELNDIGKEEAAGEWEISLDMRKLKEDSVLAGLLDGKSLSEEKFLNMELFIYSERRMK